MNQANKNECGVGLIEFAIVFPLLMMFIVAIIDYSRYSSLKVSIRESLYEAMEVAITVPNLDIDPRDKPVADFDYQRLKLARSKSTKAGLSYVEKFALASLASDDDTDTEASARLLDLVFTEDRLAGGTTETETTKLAILLPGECVFVPSMNHTECNRKSLKTTASEPAPKANPQYLIKNHPVKTVAFFKLKSFIPVLFSKPMKVEYYAYREQIPQGPFPAFEDPGLLAGELPTEPEEVEPLKELELPEEELDCTPNWAGALEGTFRRQQDDPEYNAERPINAPSPADPSVCRNE